MKFKEYEMPDGKKAVFEYDENGVGKITLECMDMLMGLINDRKTDSNSEKPNNFDKDINVRSKDEPQDEYPCEFCRNSNSQKCEECKDFGSNYEPQTERSE